MDMAAMMQEMNKKLDMLCEHMGCKKVSKDEFMEMSEDEKDSYQEKSMKKQPDNE